MLWRRMRLESGGGEADGSLVKFGCEWEKATAWSLEGDVIAKERLFACFVFVKTGELI